MTGLQSNILITGGSGTLGHAIVRTALKEGWDCSCTIYSRSELRQAEMRQRYPHCRYVLGDVRDYERLAAAVAGHDLIIHAAAMKRLPDCEAHPTECYQTNVQGSANVARAAIAGNVARVIGISTDKACAAITTYGASKRLMEGIFQQAPTGRTTFTLCRYGNVLASNGSVIPLWRRQAAEGKSLTITDRRMTRFWMTERDAVRIIQQAYVIVDRAIVVPKMGALGVEEMAQIVIPGCDMVETGLRSTEKLHEDLVHPFEAADSQAGNFLLFTGAPGGHAYTSDIAPRLSREQFLVMLDEAEDA
jgi:UDP-N-acetylglucosamine 4,6-dehydratase/5-epimerase